ncbi:MAG: 5-oxoprolinase subunit PxpA [Pseudomonadota bacterium]
MTFTIDLNADIGEGYDDESILAFVTSGNIACGGHTGDQETIARTIGLALNHDVAIGAHPSYPDRRGFGRRSIKIDPETLLGALKEQLTMIRAVAESIGAKIGHVKPHGALYNDAAKARHLAECVVAASQAVFPKATIVGPPWGELLDVARLSGVDYRAEGFSDRQYLEDGSLMPRVLQGAVIGELKQQIAQAISIAEGRGATGPKGEPVPLNVQTLCLHGDTPGAAKSAEAIHQALKRRGIDIKAPQ